MLKKYHELNVEIRSNNQFRILDIVDDPNHFCQIKTQIVGTDKTPYLSALDIVADDDLLEGFSKKDIRTITYHACEDKKKPKFKLLSCHFTDNDQPVVFSLKEFNSHNILKKTSAEIASQKNMINEMNSMDAHKIGYMRAYEESIKERIWIEKNND